MEIVHIFTLLLLEVFLPCSVFPLVNFESATLSTITRQNNGDTFQAAGVVCNPDTCVGLSSGTAAVSEEFSKGSCTCQCHRHLPAFREDLQICVDDIHECILAPFVSGSMSQQIPFVFLPLKGQIIHPSKEISFAGILTPVCAVSGAKFLTDNGWVDLRNPLDTDVPFRLYRDEGRTFLQWEGETELRNRMGGRLVLVHLMCRELGTTLELPQDIQSVFSPCVAFRVVGSPAKYLSNVSEVVFTPDAQGSDDASSSGLSISEIVAIGICSILLGLIYVASIFLYLHLRKRRKDAEKSIHRRDDQSLTNAEEGIIKSNPLLGLDRHFNIPDNSFSDTTGSDTDVTPDILQHHDERKNITQITSALIHSYHESSPYSTLASIETCHQDSTSIERLPEENVSIVETLEGREDRPENVRAIGTTRKKLYFNPAYFEPQLLLTPPPAAIEFLTKIREVITIAKQKMSAKRFTPNLLGIPEEESSYPVEPFYDYSQHLSSRRSSMISLKRENSRRRICSGCPGCEPQDFKSLCGKLPEFPAFAACENCASSSNETKQRSIRKWLEDIPVLKPVNKEDLAQHSSLIFPPNKHKRIRSPTRSMSPDRMSPSVRALSPKTASERAMSPIPAEVIYRKSPSVISHPPSKPRYRNYKPCRKPIVKPKAPPPPLPTKRVKQDLDNNSNNFSSLTSIKSDNRLRPLPPPDMIHEAMAVENKTDDARIPTITKKKMNAVINEFATQHGIDANLLNSGPELANRKEVDYETDSLERNAGNKGYSTPTDYADATSSQPSPSLSSALPMEEEMTMRNAIINTKTGNMTVSKLNIDTLQANEDGYELIILKKAENNIYNLPELLQRGNEYSLVSEVYVNNGYNYGSTPSSISSNCSTLENRLPKVRYENNKPGHLLIEVEDCPDNYIRVEDSDSFEPDTLDRKPSKLSLKRATKSDGETEFVDSLERPNQILLRTTGSFKSDALIALINSQSNTNFNRNFGSLREIYEARTRKSVQGKFGVPDKSEKTTWKNGSADAGCEGRILTLEERHSKRQRRSTSPIASDVPPDVIPPHPHDSTPIYEHPKPPRKVIKTDPLFKPPLPPKTCSGRKKKTLKSNTYEISINKQDNSVSSANSSDYESCTPPESKRECDRNMLKTFIHNNDVLLFKNGINNQFILQATTVTSAPTFLNCDDKLGTKKEKDINWTFQPTLQKYLEKHEDPGYLSTDSNESGKKNRNETEGEASLCAGSETDESLGDGHSESGAESIETHSVFFGSFRKPSCLTGSLDSGVDSDLKANSFINNALDDGASSDSENMSSKTVVTTRKY